MNSKLEQQRSIAEEQSDALAAKAAVDDGVKEIKIHRYRHNPISAGEVAIVCLVLLGAAGLVWWAARNLKGVIEVRPEKLVA